MFMVYPPVDSVVRVGHCAATVIACDKREAFAQGRACDEAIQCAACGSMVCFAALQ
jgi:hypothetical protein